MSCYSCTAQGTIAAAYASEAVSVINKTIDGLQYCPIVQAVSNLYAKAGVCTTVPNPFTIGFW